jgi:hypothetical protein
LGLDEEPGDSVVIELPAGFLPSLFVALIVLAQVNRMRIRPSVR